MSNGEKEFYEEILEIEYNMEPNADDVATVMTYYPDANEIYDHGVIPVIVTYDPNNNDFPIKELGRGPDSMFAWKNAARNVMHNNKNIVQPV